MVWETLVALIISQLLVWQHSRIRKLLDCFWSVLPGMLYHHILNGKLSFWDLDSNCCIQCHHVLSDFQFCFIPIAKILKLGMFKRDSHIFYDDVNEKLGCSGPTRGYCYWLNSVSLNPENFNNSKLHCSLLNSVTFIKFSRQAATLAIS